MDIISDANSLIQSAQRSLVQNVNGFMTNTDFLSWETMYPWWGFCLLIAIIYIFYETKMEPNALFPRMVKLGIYMVISGAILGIPQFYGPVSGAFNSPSIAGVSSCSVPTLRPGGSGIGFKTVSITPRNWETYEPVGRNRNLIIDFIAWGSYHMDVVGDAFFCPGAGTVATDTMITLWTNISVAFQSVAMCGKYEVPKEGTPAEHQSQQNFETCMNIVRDPLMSAEQKQKEIAKQVDKEEEECGMANVPCGIGKVIEAKFGSFLMWTSIILALVAIGYIGVGVLMSMAGMVLTIILSIMVNFLMVISFALVSAISIIFFTMLSPLMMIEKTRGQMVQAIKVPLSSCLFGIAAAIIIYVGAIAVVAVGASMSEFAQGDGASIGAIGNALIVAFFGTVMATVILGLQSFSMTKVPKLAHDLVNLSVTSVLSLGGEIMSMAKQVFAGAAAGTTLVGGGAALVKALGGRSAASMAGNAARGLGGGMGGGPGPIGGGGNFPSPGGGSSSSQSSQTGSPQDVKVQGPVRTESAGNANGDIIKSESATPEPQAPASESPVSDGPQPMDEEQEVRSRRDYSKSGQSGGMSMPPMGPASGPAKSAPQSNLAGPMAPSSQTKTQSSTTPSTSTPKPQSAPQSPMRESTAPAGAAPQAPSAKPKAQKVNKGKQVTEKDLAIARADMTRFERDPVSYLTDKFGKDPDSREMKREMWNNLKSAGAGFVGSAASAAWSGGIADATGSSSESAMQQFTGSIGQTGQKVQGAVQPTVKQREAFAEFIMKEKRGAEAAMILRHDGDEADFGADEAAMLAMNGRYRSYLGSDLQSFEQDLKSVLRKTENKNRKREDVISELLQTETYAIAAHRNLAGAVTKSESGAAFQKSRAMAKQFIEQNDIDNLSAEGRSKYKGTLATMWKSGVISTDVYASQTTKIDEVDRKAAEAEDQESSEEQE